MSDSTCYLCSRRFNIQTKWCNACESYPDGEFCPHFTPRIEMEEAAVQFFRTGTLPHDWEGIDMPEYYRVTDDVDGSIEFITSDKFYLFLKSIFNKIGINLDEVKTIHELAQLERDYFSVIESAIVKRQNLKKPKNLEESYSMAHSSNNHDKAAKLLKLIYERDRKGFKVI